MGNEVLCRKSQEAIAVSVVLATERTEEEEEDEGLCAQCHIS